MIHKIKALPDGSSGLNVMAVANIQTHGTTGESPRKRFERDKRAQLETNLSAVCITPETSETRKVDMTGLISWKADK